MGLTIIFSVFIAISCHTAVLANGNDNSRCSAKANVILLIPGNGNNYTSNDWFRPVEDFLLGIINYLEISEELFNVGFILYGRTPKAMNDIRPYRNRTQINTRISLLSYQGELKRALSGRPNLPMALNEMRNMFRRGERERTLTGTGSRSIPKKIGIIILNGTESYPREWRAKQLATEAKKNGVVMYTVVMGNAEKHAGLARELATDDCKTYVVGNKMNMGPFSAEEIMKEIGNNICLATDPDRSYLAGPDLLKNCFSVIEYEPPPVLPPMECHAHVSFHQDMNNCAYFFKCEDGKPYHIRCRKDNLFDPVSLTCNHKEAVTCYSQLSCPKPTGLFPYPGSCKKYLNCYNGLTYIQSCPADLHFDSTYKLCVRPQDTVCPFSTFQIPIFHYTFFR